MEDWFTVDRHGLRRLHADRPAAALLYELLSNAWDTDAKKVEMTVEPVAGRPAARVVVVDDDPIGFENIKDAWTVFGDSSRKNDPSKRGRFCLGEKLVLARATWGEIVSMHAAVRFDDTGRHSIRLRTQRGTRVELELPMTRAELALALEGLRRVMPPPGVVVSINGAQLERPTPIAAFDAKLPSVEADDAGNLRRCERVGRVELFAKRAAGDAMLFELGIPVVELEGGEDFDVDVCQKVPLNSDRDNVTPGFRRALRVAILNAAREHVVMAQEDATRAWVRDAAGDRRCSKNAIEGVLALRFGENRVAYDPSDVEAVARATAAGYVVVPGGALTAGEWSNARAASALPAAGRLFPTNPERQADSRTLAPGERSDAMRSFTGVARDLARDLLGVRVEVVFVESPGATVLATWRRGDPAELTMNVARLGASWFEAQSDGRTPDHVLELLLHEFAHQDAGDHLSEAYFDALCRLGVKLAHRVAAKGWP